MAKNVEINKPQTIKRFKQVAPFTYELVDNELTTYSNESPTMTDDSYFIPNTQAVARLVGGKPYNSDEIKLAYDFPDGKDTGLKVDGRTKGRDLAEISTDVRIKQEEAQKHFQDFITSYKREIMQESAYNAAMNRLKE